MAGWAGQHAQKRDDAGLEEDAMSAMDGGVRALLARASEHILELFGHDDNITGVGVGFRRRGGKVTDEPVVTVMVRKKRRPGLVSRRRLIPAEIDVDGTLCPTDVVQAQAVLMNADGWPGLRTERVRALRFGCGVSNDADARPDAGTLGAIVRDNTDETIGILSANHVIADNNRAPEADPIYQPAELDEPETGENQIGRLKRWVEITGGATAVDAAIAQVEAGVRVNREYRGVEIEPPDEERPAIGMLVAGDGFGNVWLTSMATTLRELSVTLLPPGRNVEASAPPEGTKLEKVGRTTAYTAGRVYATGERIEVEVPGVGVVEYTGLIKAMWLGWNGDSGAMVIRHGNQEERIEPRECEAKALISRYISEIFATCEILPTIQYAYGVPIAENDEELSDQVRDEFMSQSETGRFLITLTYLNTQLVNERLERRQSEIEQEYAMGLYERYQPIIAEMMANPESTETLDIEDRENYFDLLEHLYETEVLRSEEFWAAYSLGREHEFAMREMGRDEVMRYMNRWEVVESVRNATLEMRELVQHGPPVVMSAMRAPRGLA
jgi:hypothetical protein